MAPTAKEGHFVDVSEGLCQLSRRAVFGIPQSSLFRHDADCWRSHHRSNARSGGPAAAGGNCSGAGRMEMLCRESGLLNEAGGCERFWRSSVFGLGKCKGRNKTAHWLDKLAPLSVKC